jgi:hypothetical protein
MRVNIIRAVVLFLCVIGLAGCPSTSTSEAGGTSGGTVTASGSPTSSSGCFLSAYTRPAGKPGPPNQAVLTAAQFPAGFEPDLPEPDIPIVDAPRPLDGDQQDEENWADDGESTAKNVPLTEGVQAATKANLQTESNGVVGREVSTLLTDDLDSLASGDPGYGADVCSSVEDLYTQFGDAMDNLDNLNQIVGYLNNLAAPNGTSAPSDLATVIEDATTQFQDAFGGCVDNFDTIKWIVDQIHYIFCE